jgi:hypothetical protein
LGQAIALYGNGAEILNLSDYVGRGDRYGYLDDYINVLNEWSLRRNPNSGKNLRQHLTFAGEISAWWFLAFTEKATTSEAVEIFKTISILDQIALPIEEMIFVGELKDSKPFELVATQLGIPFLVANEKLAENSADPALRILENKSFSVLRGLFFNFTKRLFSKAISKTDLVFLSDFPQAWSDLDGAPFDRYLGQLYEFFGKKKKLGFNIALQMGEGLPLNSRSYVAVKDGIGFCKKFSKSKPQQAIDLIDLHSRFFSFLRAKIWSYWKKFTLSRHLSARAFGKIEYRGIDLTAYFSNEIIGSLLGRIPHLLSQGLDTSLYLRRTRAKICFYRNEFYCYGRVHSWASLRAGIPSFGVQHGIINSKYGVYQFHPSELQGDFFKQDMINAIPSPVCFGLWGEWYRKQITAFSGYPASALPIIGNPRILGIANETRIFDKSAFKIAHGFSNDSYVVLFTVQDLKTLDAIVVFLQALVSFESEKRLEVIFKLHHFHEAPMEKCIRKLLPDLDNVIFRFQKGDLAEMIKISDVVVTAYSATGVEALLLNRPLITIQLPTIAGDSSFREMSTQVFEVSTAMQINLALERILLHSEELESATLVKADQKVFSFDVLKNERSLEAEILRLSTSTVGLR